MAERKTGGRSTRDRAQPEKEKQRIEGPKGRNNVFLQRGTENTSIQVFASAENEVKEKIRSEETTCNDFEFRFSEEDSVSEKFIRKDAQCDVREPQFLQSIQEKGDSLESFHASLDAQTVKSEMDVLYNELLRDLFSKRL